MSKMSLSVSLELALMFHLRTRRSNFRHAMNSSVNFGMKISIFVVLFGFGVVWCGVFCEDRIFIRQITNQFFAFCKS